MLETTIHPATLVTPDNEYTHFTNGSLIIMSRSNFNELGFYEVFMKLSMSNSFKNDYLMSLLNDSPGLLVLTGRPVNRPAGRPAKTIVLAGQKRPKLNISRNLHDFA